MILGLIAPFLGYSVLVFVGIVVALRVAGKILGSAFGVFENGIGLLGAALSSPWFDFIPSWDFSEWTKPIKFKCPSLTNLVAL